MPILERTVVDQVVTLSDGRLKVIEVTEFYDSVSKDILGSDHRRGRVIEVGDDVASEDPLVKDVAKGVHTPGRKAARDGVRQNNPPNGPLSRA